MTPKDIYKNKDDKNRLTRRSLLATVEGVKFRKLIRKYISVMSRKVLTIPLSLLISLCSVLHRSVKNCIHCSQHPLWL